MRIPTKKECFELIREMEMLEHIANHSIQVSRVALLITEQLMVKNAPLNRQLVFAASLLHDITKTRSFKTGENHAQTGGQLLRDLNFPEVGDIIAQHVSLKNYDNFNGFPHEAEIVNYADKRVLHDKIVSFNQRMEYILEHYGKIADHRDKINQLWNRTIKLEYKIFSNLPFAPDDLTNRLLDFPSIEYFKHL
jgi:putative nucleotidyltransferase with HDIG domain